MTVETSLAPETVRHALLDFTERRPEIWPGITPSQYEVYSVGETTADIKEGTKLPFGAFWAKERYDWSTPGLVTWTVQESNFSTPGDYVAVTLHPREGGGTRVHIEWNRTGMNFKGRLAVRLITLTKGKAIAASVQKAFRNLEREPTGG